MNLFAFGLGYSALGLLSNYGDMFNTVTGTVRHAVAGGTAAGANLEVFQFGPEGGDALIPERLAAADVLLVSIPPGTSVDPVLSKFGRKLVEQRRLRIIVYLSTVGVYGDHDGQWVDEGTLPAPKSERSRVRLATEKAWSALAGPSRQVHILRLAGIYGPGRNPLIKLRDGTAHRYIKPGQVFNRIHVDDIAQVIASLLTQEGPGGIWNVSDDEPAPPQDVITYAASLMGVEPPPEQDVETADISAMAKSFYAENKRASNRKLKERLGVNLAFPTYREGLQALWNAGEGRSNSPIA